MEEPQSVALRLKSLLENTEVYDQYDEQVTRVYKSAKTKKWMYRTSDGSVYEIKDVNFHRYEGDNEVRLTNW